MLMVAFAAILATVSEAGTPVVSIETPTARHEFKVEIMRTAEDRARGLMYRMHMDTDHGMLFDFGSTVIARMWMKNTYIPLDMLFIRTDGTISNIARNTIPHSTEVLSSDGEVRYVLEINGGISDQLGISAGDVAKLPK